MTTPTGSWVETPFAECYLVLRKKHSLTNPLVTGEAVIKSPAVIWSRLFLKKLFKSTLQEFLSNLQVKEFRNDSSRYLFFTDIDDFMSVFHLCSGTSNGNWSSTIFFCRKLNRTIHIGFTYFPSFYDVMNMKFTKNPRIRLFTICFDMNLKIINLLSTFFQGT